MIYDCYYNIILTVPIWKFFRLWIVQNKFPKRRVHKLSTALHKKIIFWALPQEEIIFWALQFCSEEVFLSKVFCYRTFLDFYLIRLRNFCVFLGMSVFLGFPEVPWTSRSSRSSRKEVPEKKFQKFLGLPEVLGRSHFMFIGPIKYFNSRYSRYFNSRYFNFF